LARRIPFSFYEFIAYNLSSQSSYQHQLAIMSDNGSPNGGAKPDDQPEHLNIKVTDSNNEVFFKIKRTTALKKLMDAFCERQGKSPTSVRFLFDGVRVNPDHTPESVSLPHLQLHVGNEY
jgi:hypothetical protein